MDKDAASGRMSGSIGIGTFIVSGARSMQGCHVCENGAHMIIWTGRGILIFLIFIAVFFIAVPLELLEIGPVLKLGADQEVNFAIALAAFLSAIATYPLDRFIMKQRDPQIQVDPKTGQQQLVSRKDTLFWIETRYWTYLFLALAAVMLVVTYLF